MVVFGELPTAEPPAQPKVFEFKVQGRWIGGVFVDNVRWIPYIPLGVV